ncbi:UNVERIFIED_CONTAM: hypothetical protein RMT77_008232 [Armadillidium vulgare]
MKLLELCVAICCIILIFTINLSKSDDPSSTSEQHKDVRSKRSSDVSPIEKENETKNPDLTKQKRDVLSKGSCQNTIQSEKALIRELLKTIEDFQHYLKTKKGISPINEEEDDTKVEDLIGFNKGNNLFKDKKKKGGLGIPHMSLFDNFGDMNSPLSIQPIQPNYDISAPKPFERQMERSNDPWKLEVPNYFDISPALNRRSMISVLQPSQSENQPNNFNQEINPFEKSLGPDQFQNIFYKKK